MREELLAIDTAAVDELGRITQEQDVLRSRLEAMEVKRGGVSEEVFARVRGDYEARCAALEQDAEPLKERAREQYARLGRLVEALAAGLKEARLAREELELRHALGEFDDLVFADRVAAMDEQVAEREAEVAEADAIVQRFVAAFGSEEELRRSDADVVVGATTEDVDDGDAAAGAGPAEAPGSAVEATAVGVASNAETVAGAPAAEAAPQGPPHGPPPPPTGGADTPASVPVNSAFATDALEVARLVALSENGTVAAEFSLQLGTTTVGRAPKNDIRIRDASVSREHAKIVFTDRGFAIYDLGSENGVWVNGERTKHAVLSEDDVVEFGPGVSPMVFKGP